MDTGKSPWLFLFASCSLPVCSYLRTKISSCSFAWKLPWITVWSLCRWVLVVSMEKEGGTAVHSSVWSLRESSILWTIVYPVVKLHKHVLSKLRELSWMAINIFQESKDKIIIFFKAIKVVRRMYKNRVKGASLQIAAEVHRPMLSWKVTAKIQSGPELTF